MSDLDPITTYDEASTETNMLIKDVNECVKKIKSKKEIEESDFDEFKTESTDLKQEIDLLIEDVEGIKKEDNSQVKFFDTKKKSLISKLNDSKKQLDDQRTRIEKQLQNGKADRDKKLAEKSKQKDEKNKEKDTKKESDKKDDSKDDDKKNKNKNKKDDKPTPDEHGDTKSNKSIEENIPTVSGYSDEEFEEDDDNEKTVMTKESDTESIPKPQPRKSKDKNDKHDEENKESEKTEKESKDKNKFKKDKKNRKSKTEDELEDIKEEIVESENEETDKKKEKDKKENEKESKKKNKENDEEDHKDKKKKSKKNDKEKDKKEDKNDKEEEKEENENNKKKGSSFKDRFRDSFKKSSKHDDDHEDKMKEKDDDKNKEKGDKKSFQKQVEEEIQAEKEHTVQAAVAAHTLDASKDDKDIFPPSQKLLITETVKKVEEDDLECQHGDIVEFIESCDDEEFIYVKDSENKEGFIPLKSVKIYKKEEITEQVEKKSKKLRKESKMKSKDKIEKTFKEDEMRTETSHQEQKPKNLSDKFQGSMKKRHISDVLQFCGDLPSGFRFSTVEKWSKRDYNHSLKAKLSKSALSISDLFINPDSSMIRPRPTRIQRFFQIIKAFQMPKISNEFQVQSHHVKVCLFDQEKPTSNVYILKAVINEKDKRIWMFNNKMVESSKSTEFNELFIRSDMQNPELCILLEFCVLGKKVGGDDTQFEFSCGWCKIPLYEENGQVINNKNGDFQLNGGTLFEEGIDVDPTVMTSTTTRRMFASNPAPQVTIKILQPNKENKDYIETLPDNIVGSTLHLPLFSYYRSILADNVLNKREDLTSAEPIYSPFLVAFLEACKTRDILDVTRIVWWEKFKMNRSLNKKDPVAVIGYFQEVFMDHIYPLTKLVNLPPYSMLDTVKDKERWTKLMEFIQKSKENKLAPLLSGEFSFSPVMHTELSFKVIHSNSKCIE